MAHRLRKSGSLDKRQYSPTIFAKSTSLRPPPSYLSFFFNLGYSLTAYYPIFFYSFLFYELKTAGTYRSQNCERKRVMITLPSPLMQKIRGCLIGGQVFLCLVARAPLVVYAQILVKLTGEDFTRNFYIFHHSYAMQRVQYVRST